MLKRFIFIIFLGFFYTSSASAGKYDIYYTCYASMASVYGCDASLKFSTADEAAKAFGFTYSKTIFDKSYTSGPLVEYEFIEAVFSGCSSGGSVSTCSFVVGYTETQRGGNLPAGTEKVTSDTVTYSVMVKKIDPGQNIPNCAATLEAKGTTGGVVESDEKKYVLSRATPNSICTGSCSYDSPRSSSCYLELGSQTTGFCNFTYSLIKDPEDANYPLLCSSWTDYDEPEEGDPLNPEGNGEDGGSTCLEEGCDGENSGEGDPGGNGSSGGDEGGNDGGGSGSGSEPGEGGEGGSDEGNGSGEGGNSGSGSGDGEGEGGGNSGSGDGPGGEDAGEFVSPGQLEINTQDLEISATAAASRYASSYKQSATYQALSGFSDTSNSGTCPIGSVDLLGKTIVFDGHCQLFDRVKPTLEIVFKAAWTLLGVLIIISA